MPYTARTAEHFRWLVTEIQEMNGEAQLWRSNLVLGLQEDSLTQKFIAQVDEEYARLLRQLNHRHPDLSELSRQYQQIQAKDYFGSDLGKQVRARFVALRGDGR